MRFGYPFIASYFGDEGDGGAFIISNLKDRATQPCTPVCSHLYDQLQGRKLLLHVQVASRNPAGRHEITKLA